MPFPQTQTAALVNSANITANKTVAYTAVSGDIVVCDTTTTGAFTVTLPPVATGGPVTVRNITGTNAVTVKTSDSSTIDGVAGSTGIAYTTIHTGATFVSDGVRWIVAGN